MSKATDTQWRVEFRIVNSGKWRKAGLFETRTVARAECAKYRFAYGFGNTRVVKYQKK